MLIANKDIETRLKKARTAREKDAAAYTKGATEVAGWQSGASNAQKQAEQDAKDKESNIQKFGDLAKRVGTGIASSYKSLGDTLGTIAASQSGDVKNAQKSEESYQKSTLATLKQMNDVQFDPNSTPEQKAHAKKAHDSIYNDFKTYLDNKDKDTNSFDNKVKKLSVKKTAGDVASIATDVLSAGTYGGAAKGARTARLAKSAEVADKVVQPVAKTVLKGAATGAGVNAAGDIVQQSLDEKKGIDLKELAAQGGLGAVLGGIGSGVSVRGSNKAVRASEAADKASMDLVGDSANAAADHLDNIDKFAASQPDPNVKLLGAGGDRIQSRIDEIDQVLNKYRGNEQGSAFTPDPKTMDNLGHDGAEKLTNTPQFQRNAKDGMPVVSKEGATGTFGEVPGQTTQVHSAKELRDMMKERAALVTEQKGLSSISKFDGARAPKLDTKDPQFRDAVDNELQAVDNAHTPEVAKTGEFKDKQTGKVNALIDYFRTPTHVLDRIGLKDTRQVVERSFENYRKDLSSNLQTLSGWEKRVGNDPEASKRIFNWLDGDKTVRLQGQEAIVAKEMKAHLETWADKLGLDKNQRVSDYITHIFEGDLKGKTNDVTLSSILDNKGTTKAYNPFTQKRLGQKGYKEDAFAAMEAYMKKSTRQVNMDPALKITADAAKNVDDRTARYLLKLNQGIAMKPDKFETMINDVISSVPGVEGKFGNTAGTKLMRGWRNTVYRATLGMNVGSALRNLTQGTNTFAELGTRRTLQGYSSLVRAMGDHASGKGSKLWDEMEREGIFGDAFHQQDRNVTTLSKGLKKADKGLWAMFDFAEKINRGSAYAGAKAAALGKKMTEEEAIKYAKKVVGDTQFRFNDVETPLVLRSQALKTLGQFQSFNLKQAEFLGGKGKSTLKTLTGKGNKQDAIEMYKLARWVGANIAVASTVGTVLGLKWTDAIPDFGAFRGVRSPLLTVGNDVKGLVEGKDQYGQDTPRTDLLKSTGKDLFGLTAPGGTQIQKTATGLSTVNKGESKTDSGKLRYTVENNTENKIRGGLFGPYNLDEGQQYFDKGRQALTHKQTDVIDAVPSGEEQAYETMFRNMGEKHDSKLNTSNKIRDEIKNKNFVKAKRLADAHNAEVESEISALSGKVGTPPKDVVDYIRSTYKVNYEYYLRNKK